MRFLRRVYGWAFAFTAVMCLAIGCWLVLDVVQRIGASLPRIVWLEGTILPAESVIFALASWAVLKAKPSARAWGIVAGLLLILDPISVYLLTSTIEWSMIVVGFLGVAVFAWPDTESGSALRQDAGT